MPHILIVDDDQSLGLLLSRTFVRAGYEVRLANSAIEAMALCNAISFDAVLSDVDMPKMDGHQLACWVADNHPRLVCVLMSGFGSECERCPFAGGCILLRKPFNPKEAVKVIEQRLNPIQTQQPPN